MKSSGHHNFDDEPRFPHNHNHNRKENLSTNQNPNISISKTNPKMTSTDSNEYTINSQILSSQTEMSSYNSYGDFDEKNPNKSTQNETENGSKSINTFDDNNRKHKKKQIAFVLEAIFKNCRGRTKITQKICKLCLYDASLTDFGSLLAPCKCRGNLRYIHEECLKTYLILRKHDLERTSCESCKAQISMKIEYKSCFYPGKILKEGLISFVISVLLFLVLFCLLFLLIIYLCFFEIEGSILNLNGDFKDNKVLYLLFLAMLWIVVFFIVLVSLITTSKNCCLVKNIHYWKISNFHNNAQPKEEIEEEEETPKSCIRNWCPLHFLRFRNKKENVSNKVQNKYEFSIISKKEHQFLIKNHDNNKKKSPSASKNVSILDFEKNNNNGLEFNQELPEKFSAVNPENGEKKKTARKFNFTFRIDENFPSKSIPIHEESKSKPMTIQILQEQIDEIKPATKNLLDSNNGISLFPEKEGEIPILTRGLTKSRRNSFQNNLKRISKEKLVEDINNVISVISKSFINQDYTKYFRIKMVLKIHSFSLEYVRNQNKILASRPKTIVKPNARITTHETLNNINNDRKKMLCLRKKSHD